jgi:outer-membrane receptor for ferric coprogen and ferric-rhodotorulic acid
MSGGYSESVRAADDSQAICSFHVSPQPLDSTLLEIGHHCGVQLAYLTQLTNGKTAPGLEGSYSVEAALARVLVGTGLVFRRINANTIEILPAPATATADRPPTDNAPSRNTRQAPSGRPNSSDVPEVVVESTIEGLVATRTETPIRAIPQTVSVVSSEQIRQQNDTSLADVLANAVGITATQFDSVNQVFYSRGFQIDSYHLDGGSALHTAAYSPILNTGSLFLTPDISEFDHVEVLRGSDALFGAGGNPGATVNLVRKRPLDSDEVAFNETAGSWNNYRSEGDVTGPIAFDGSLRGRLDVAYTHRDYFFDGASLGRKNLFGAVEYAPTPRTVITAGGSYASMDSHPFEGGLPLFPDGSDPHLPQRTGYVFDWERLQAELREGYLRFEQKFVSDWRLLVNATSLDGSSNYDLGQFESAVDPVSKELGPAPVGSYTVRPTLQRQVSAEATITGSAQWLGVHAEMAFGADFARSDTDQTVAAVPAVGSPLVNAYLFSPVGYPDPRTVALSNPLGSPGLIIISSSPPARNRESDVESGYFASLRLERKPLALTLGLRVSNDKSTQSESLILFGEELAAVPLQTYSSNGKVTPYIGGMFTLDRHFSLYASYADIYDPNAGSLLRNGSTVHPADGINMEGGVKGEWRDGAVNGTLALYSIVQRGLAGYESPSPGAPIGSNCCYLPDGERKAKGVDVELNGKPAPGWLISAGYTFNNNVSLIPYEFPGTEISQTPRHLLKAWTSWQLPGGLRDWSVGATLEARSSASSTGVGCLIDASDDCLSGNQVFKVVQRAFIVVSPRIGYQINSKWRAALTVNNVFDRIYYQTIGSPEGGNWYGDPRNFQFRVDGKL